MTVILSAIAFVLLLSVLILIHEWGHFTAAKKAGVVVEEFGFGLPPRAKTFFRKGHTEFTLNWIPFGGFVRLRGENALTARERTAKGSFGAAPIPARLAILTAGVFMNFLLAIVLLTIGFSFGKWIPTYFSVEEMQRAEDQGILSMDPAVLISDVISGGAAAKVGIPEKSILAAIDGQPVEKPDQVPEIQKGKKSVVYTILSGERFTEEKTFTVDLIEGKSGVVIGQFPRNLTAPTRSLSMGFMLAMRESKVMTIQTVYGIGQLVGSLAQRGRIPEGITGLVGIAQLTHESVQEGFMTYLRLVALLSLSLAVLNILPFPALDGGRVLFVLAELIGRRPVNRRFELVVNGVGFVVLIGVIVLITFHDIVRLF